MALPKEIRTNHGFIGSVFGLAECEIMLRNILLLQQQVNPDAWTPFSWCQYKAFCTHLVPDEAKLVLDAFVSGGRPVWNSPVFVSGGWLRFDGTHYHFTEKMIDMLAKDYPITQ